MIPGLGIGLKNKKNKIDERDNNNYDTDTYIHFNLLYAREDLEKKLIKTKFEHEKKDIRRDIQ